jgi:adenylate cyclase
MLRTGARHSGMDSTWQGTVLLADLRRDAARLYQSAGPTQALQAIRECMAVLEQAAWEGGATFVRASGDEVMALFPAPAAAADAASAMQMAADALSPVGDTKLGVRIAFQTGPVTVRNGDVLGNTVSMTSRLIEEAQKEQIITSRDTAAALGHSYRNRMRTVRPSQTLDPVSSLGLCEFVWRVNENTTRLSPAAIKQARDGVLRLHYGITEVISKGEHNPVSLGRDFQCGVIILDDLASRRHCTIEQRSGEYVLIDHSTNGTYVTEEGDAETRLHQASLTLRRHGWLAFGQPRERTDQVVEYFCG